MPKPLRDGVHVAYIGEDGQHDIGDRGQVLMVSGDHSHVMWSTGAHAGDVTYVYNDDLVKSAGRPTSYDDSLEGPLTTIAVRATFEHYGARGVIDAMEEEGHLGTLAVIAEEAAGTIAQRIRADLGFQAVLSQLDHDDSEEVVQRAARLVEREIREILGGGA